MLKRHVLSLVFCLGAVSLSTGCGMTQMPGKMDTSNDNMNDMKSKMDTTNNAMGDMKSKMDTTNNTMSQMKQDVDQSNGLQTQLLNGINTSNSTQQNLLGGINASNSTQTQLLNQIQTSNGTQLDIKSAVSATNSKIESTNDGVRLQKLAISLQNLFSDRVTRYLYPLPVDMITWGQTAAQTMHEDEFVGELSALLADINAVSSLDPANPPATIDPVLAKNTDNDKLIDLWAVRILAGTAPQALIEQMMDIEITKGGPNADVVPQVLAARWDFIFNDLIQLQLYSSALDTPGKIRTGKDLATALDYIDSQKLDSPIELQTMGMLNSSDNVDIKIDPSQVQGVWQKCADAFTQNLKPAYKALLTGTGPDAQALQALKAQVTARLAPPATTTPKPLVAGTTPPPQPKPATTPAPTKS